MVVDKDISCALSVSCGPNSYAFRRKYCGSFVCLILKSSMGYKNLEDDGHVT